MDNETENTNQSFNKGEEHHIKIMVVDDDPGIRFTVKSCLKECSSNFDVVDVESGFECLDYLKNKYLPDVILLDVMMPKMNGWDVAAEIKRNHNWGKIPIIFLTAVTDSSSKSFGGIVSNDYITKPFDIDNLKQRIEQILRDKK